MYAGQQAETMESTAKIPESSRSQPVIEEQDLSISDYLEIVRRRRWLLILPALLIFLAVAVVAMMLPNQYESRATFLIEQPTIARDLVRTTVRGSDFQQLQVIGQRVLGRARLRELIETHGLYLEERRSMPIDDVAGMMREHIGLQAVRGDPLRGRVPEGAIAFVLSYESASPELSRTIVNELTELFLSENTEQRQAAARETTRFLDQEAARVQREVEAIEARLAAFREANRNSLPEMQNINTQQLNRAEENLRRTRQDLRAAEERVSSLQAQLIETNPSPHLERLQSLEEEYATLASLYTERHPARLRVKRELEALRADAGGVDRVTNPVYLALNNQFQTALTERGLLQSQMAEIRQDISTIEQRLGNTNVIRVEYDALTRDHDAAVAQFRDLRRKILEAQLAESLEAEGKAERFVLIQPANLPVRPSSPNRPALLFMGLVLGFGGGLGLVVVRESLDGGVHGPHGVMKSTGIPPLAMIPYLHTDAELAALRQRRIVMVAAGGVLILAALAFVHYQVQPLDELFGGLSEQAGAQPAP